MRQAREPPRRQVRLLSTLMFDEAGIAGFLFQRRDHAKSPAMAANVKMLSRSMATAASGKTLTIGLLPADGIGREVIPAARLAIETVCPGKFKFLDLQAGFELFQKTGVALPEETIQALKSDCQGALFGAVRCGSRSTWATPPRSRQSFLPSAYSVNSARLPTRLPDILLLLLL